MAGVNRLTLSAVNSMDFDEFIDTFGNIIEHCPVIAAAIWSKRPFSTAQDIYQAVCDTIDKLPTEVQQGILRCHPDLAGKLAATEQLSRDSTNEQRGSGLLNLSVDERQILGDNNKKYKNKFGFPFVICVKENKKEAIMSGIRRRLQNTTEEELVTGISEVKKIGYHRLCGLVEIEPKL